MPRRRAIAFALALALVVLPAWAALGQCPPGVGSCPAPAPPQAQAQAPVTRLAIEPGLPAPWASAVRVVCRPRDRAGQSIGSGTIVVSSPERSVVLTCAHVFAVGRGVVEAGPDRFPGTIQVDLFDGRFRASPANQLTATGESLPGRALDWDADRDVGLIEVRPGRVLPASPVVVSPAPLPVGSRLVAIGCDRGADASAWSTTVIRGDVRGGARNPGYVGTETTRSPTEGRSGGGLYTFAGRVAGVCDFGSNSTGIYAAPESIHAVLRRTSLLEEATANPSSVGISIGGGGKQAPRPVSPIAPPLVQAPSPAPPQSQSQAQAPVEVEVPLRPIGPPDRPGGLAADLGALAADLFGWATWANVLGLAGLGLGGTFAHRANRRAAEAAESARWATMVAKDAQFTRPSAGPDLASAALEAARRLTEALAKIEAARKEEEERHRQLDELAARFPSQPPVAGPGPAPAPAPGPAPAT